MPEGIGREIDQEIKRMLLEGNSPKLIKYRTRVSLSTISRRRQELKVRAIQNQRQYDRHQEQLVQLARDFHDHVSLPEPAYMYIENLDKGKTWTFEGTIEWHRSLDSVRNWAENRVRLDLPLEVQKKEVEFFGHQVELLPLFKAHTLQSGLWHDYDQWATVGGDYVRACSARINGIKQEAVQETGLPIVADDGEQGILDGFCRTIYSVSLRTLSPEVLQVAQYKIVSPMEPEEQHRRLCLVQYQLPPPDKWSTWEGDNICRVPKVDFEAMIAIHEKLLAKYRQPREVGPLTNLYEKVKQAVDRIRQQLDLLIKQEFVPGTCLLCTDWTKSRR